MFYIFLILCSTFHIGVSVTCPPRQHIERMRNKTITCSVDGVIERCFWYLGSTATTPPIVFLKLLDGIKGGTKLNDDHFDITSDCGMEIIEAQISHEANYTFLALFSNGSEFRQVVSVLVTVTPAQLCPIIPTCDGCDDCIVKSTGKKVGKVTCDIDGIRPPVQLYWQHDGALTIISNLSHSEPSKAGSDTWKSSATLQYTLPCEKDAVIRCKSNRGDIPTAVVNVVSVCNQSVTSVNISETPLVNICQKRPHTCWMMLGIPVVSICTAGIIIVLIFYFRRRTGKEETADTKCLTKKLKTIYKDQFNTEIENLYTSCEVITCCNRSEAPKTFDEICDTSFISQHSRVLLIGEPGYGKTFCFHHLISKWIKGDTVPTFLVIYFPLRFLSLKSNVLMEIAGMLQETTISIEDLNKIFTDKECIILLDGLNFLEIKQNSTNDTNSDNTDGYDVTVDDLLQNKYADYFPNMKVWMCSRPLKHYKKKVEEPFTLVNMVGFTKTQRNQLFSLMSKRDGESDENTKNSVNEALSTGQEYPLLPRKNQHAIEVAWENHFKSFKDTKVVSPLVVYLFALNFLRSDETSMIPNSTSPVEVSWETNNFTIELKQIDWHLLACVFKSCSQTETKRVQIENLFRGYNMIFKKDERSYNRDTVTEICIMCREFDVELDKLTFWKDYPTALTKYLPKVKNEVIFREIRLDEGSFISLMNNLQEGIPTLRFVDCKLSENFNKEDFKEGTTTTVIRMKGNTPLYFRFEDATWSKEARTDLGV